MMIWTHNIASYVKHQIFSWALSKANGFRTRGSGETASPSGILSS